MILGMELIREEEEAQGMIPLGVDNQAAITATRSIKPAPSHYIWDAFHRHLRGASRKHPHMDLLVRWTPGHAEIEGNEMADFEAKSAITDGPSGAMPKFLSKRLPRSKAAARQHWHAKLKALAAKNWRTSPRYPRLANVDLALPSPSFLRLITKLPHKHAVILFQLRTGHAPLAQHLFRLGKADSPVCPCCNMHEENVNHYLLFCPAHGAARSAMHHEGGVDTQHAAKLLSQPTLLKHLFRYIARSARLRSVYGEISQLPDPEE